VSGEQQDGAAEEVRTFLDALPPRIDIVADWTRGGVRNALTAEALGAVLAERDALAARVAELEAVVAEGNQRARALALLLLRSGGQVEFTQVEQVTAPLHGHLISYPNLATGGLVLAYSADGETVGAAPEGLSATEAAGEGAREPVDGNTSSILPQGLSEPEPCDGDCDCDCQPGQPCLCPERDCYCGPCRVCGDNPQRTADDTTEDDRG
jgi:hypothetical protein